MPRILLVEDDEMNRAMLRRRLERAGYEVAVADDGRQALELAASLAPDFIIMDLGLPELDGWEATRRLKADPITRPIPIMALTAHAMAGDRDKAVQAGCDEYETKPVDLPRVLAKIQALLLAPARPAEPGDPASSEARAKEDTWTVRRPPDPNRPPVPPAPTAETLTHPALAAVPPRPTPKATGQKILVVEDNAANREMLRRRLVAQGYVVTGAGDGAEALELLAAQSFDLILLDIMMPEVDGYQVLERLKAEERWRELPVIMISALDSIDSISRCIAMGADHYLFKPFDPVLLQAGVTACLEKKRLRDLELEYLRNVSAVTRAAAALERGEFRSEELAEAAGRGDELGQLARVFCRMGEEVVAREQRLKDQMQQLRIEIDESRRSRQVDEIVGSDYFQSLQQKVQQLRNRARKD